MAVLLTALFAVPAMAADDGVDFTQDANQNTVLSEATWINGILNKNNSEYAEGMSVPQRLIIVGIATPNGSDHSIKLRHLATKTQGQELHNAYDYLTSWAQALDAGDGVAPTIPNSNWMGDLLDPTPADGSTGRCADLGVQITTAMCEALTTGGNTMMVDVPDHMNPAPWGDDIDASIVAYESVFGNRQIEIFANAPVSAASLTFDGYQASGADYYAAYTLEWTSSATQILVRYAGHLAVGFDPLMAGIGYGNGPKDSSRGAGGISGGNYHQILDMIDGDALGSRDNQIQASSIIIPPPMCQVDCDNQTICAGEDAGCCASAAGGIPPYTIQWHKDDGTLVGDCRNVGFGESCCLSITSAATTATGTYSATVVDSRGEASSQACAFDLTVNERPTCNPDDICLGEELCAGGSGGQGPYACAWSGPGIVPNDGSCCFTPTAAGTFNVVVTDANGCVSNECSGRVANPPSSEAGDPQDRCLAESGPTCLTLSGSGSGTPAWSQLGQFTDPADCVISITSGDTFTPTVCFAAGCTGDAGFRLTVSGDPACPPATDATVATVYPNPTCDLSAAEVTGRGVITGGTVSGGTGPYTCSASFNAESGWDPTGCTVSAGGDITVTFDVDAATDAPTAQLSVTVTDANGCTHVCEQQVGILIACEVLPSDPVCEDVDLSLFARPVLGLDGQTIEWFGPFDGNVECGGQTLGAPIRTCTDLDVLETCELDVDTGTPGVFTYCARATEAHGFSSLCGAPIEVFENPACSVNPPFSRICEGESIELCVTGSGGEPPYTYRWNTGETTTCITVSPTVGTHEFSATVTDANGCESDPCTADLNVENCACRVTGGGVDGTVPPQSWVDGVDSNDHYTFGGQAGAPTAAQPQPSGEWTHRQHKGAQGKFTFHAGTASAPEDTFIRRILCHDPDNCNPARPAPSKQIDFEGVGSFQNIGNGGFDVARYAEAPHRTLHWFEVHIEDLGEPGSQDDANLGSAICPYGGHANEPNGDEKCDCPDFYHIRIFQNADEAAPGFLIYEVKGYINGGNLQIHPPIGG
jgi:hypothetical protein